MEDAGARLPLIPPTPFSHKFKGGQKICVIQTSDSIITR
jgi:hypothetical protein